MLTPTHIYLPVLAAGILFTGGLLFALAARALKLAVFGSGALLLLTGFVHAAFDAATAAAGPILGNLELSFQLYRLEQLSLAWLLPPGLYFLRHIVAVPRKARRFQRCMERGTLAFALGLTLVAFLWPDLFVSVERETLRAAELQIYHGHGAPGPLFDLRDFVIGVVLIHVLLLVFWVRASSTYRLRQSAWLVGSLILAVCVGGLSLAEHFLGVNMDTELTAGIDTSLLALSLFALGAMVDIVRSFLGKVKMLDRVREALSKKQQAMEEYLYSDLLTGLPNRESFYRDLEERLEQGPEDARAGIVFMDIDDFQGLNESFGTRTVDRLIAEAAKIVRSVESGSVTAYRTGTDEFALLVRGAVGPDRPTAMARRIQSSLLTGFDVEGRRHSCGVSIGILMIPQDGDDVHAIGKNGYSAVRRAKQQRNSIVTYDESMRLEAESKLRLVSELRQSIGAKEFYMVYQPLVGREPGRLRGEALLRWNHPRGEHVSPSRFIRAAEDAGLVQHLGSRSMEILADDLRELSCAGVDMEVSFNLSAQQFSEPGFCKRLAGILGESGYPFANIVLEITESAFVERMQRVREGLEYLHSLGLRVAVDDFGTGYSSLSYLRDLPVDRLKVDRSFVERLPGDERSLALLKVVRETCSLFGLEMVVEGVEREEQLNELRTIAPDIYQGFLFGRPGTLESLIGQRGREAADPIL
ncbi:MAG: putative bifunctional diguanylate cyclase/phosphodiesterase [Spirochaetaceae bacterium]